MMIMLVILIPIVGGLLAWRAERASDEAPRIVSIAALTIELVLLAVLWAYHAYAPGTPWLLETQIPWIPRFGMSFHFAMDGISLLMIALTAFLGILSVLTSWTEIKHAVGFFHFNLMWVLGGIVGVFLAMDLFLFYFFWEMMLIPMYLLIAIWGHENRVYASIKFFIFTQLSGLLMLLAILGLYFVHGRATGVYTFDYAELLNTPMTKGVASLLMAGFLIAFAVKLPAFPVHNWLPDAHTEAPTAGSVILAGLLLKTGAYGIIRFVVPLFPAAFADFAPYGMAIGVIGIIYGALLAYAQTDLKRLVAYTSVSHMGFVLLGICAWNTIALQGVVMQMICHGIGTGALFIMVGALQERIHTRDVAKMGGLWAIAPVMGGIGIFFAMASLGLPGMGSFIAEFLILVGAYKVSVWMVVFASLGLVAATIYSLRIVHLVFHGGENEPHAFPDYSIREIFIMGALMIAMVFLGLYPRPVTATAEPALNHIEQLVESAPQAKTQVSFLREGFPSHRGDVS